MTEDFKKGLATGIAVGGVTINKQQDKTILLTKFERVSEQDSNNKFAIKKEMAHNIEIIKYEIC